MNDKKDLLQVSNASLSFGGVKALDNINLSLKHNELLAIIGPNGAGKTSALNCISGYYRPQTGDIIFKNRSIKNMPVHKRASIGIARTFQNVALFDGLTTLENIMAARHIPLKPSAIAGCFHFGRERRKEIRNREIVEEIIDFLEIQAIRKKIVASLPYGFRKRVELGRALAMEPEILLLDEPMAGMNLEEKEDMARFIIDIFEEKKVAMIMIEHDMELVMDIADRIVVLDFGSVIADGTPDEVGKNPQVIEAYLGKE